MPSSARSTEQRSLQLHPAIYKTMVGLVVWFVVSAWAFFGDAGYLGLILVMMSVLFIMATGIPFVLWLTDRNARDEAAPSTAPSTASAQFPQSFTTWKAGSFDTWTGQCKGSAAAIEVLLPVAAVAFGIMLIGIVFDYVARSAV